MAEYIKREAARMAACKLCDWYGSNMCAENKCDHPIESVPAADVVERNVVTPIRHYKRFYNSDGEVVREIRDGWMCPVCGSTRAENYCPNCGAEMDGGADDA